MPIEGTDEEELHPAEDPAATFRSHRRGAGPAEPAIRLATDSDSAGSSSAREFLGKLGAQRPASVRYEFQGEIGRGGMGVILKVVDQDLKRALAMKVILGSGADARGSTTADVSEHQLRRFLEEAQITGQLDHPGIVPVHELGMDEKGRTYFTMRLIKGRDLKSLFERRDEKGEVWSIARSLGVVLKICETMAFAHAKGVVHRDLKPANIMVGRFGEAYVMDWGLAKVVQRDAARGARPSEPSEDVSRVWTAIGDSGSDSVSQREATLQGDVLGTPSYMSPEQARGQQDLVSTRSDIYSLGAMVYHLLTQRAPYEVSGRRSGGREVLARLLAGPPTPISDIAPQVPGELVAIVEKAMAREIEDRYADMLEMADDIQAFLEGRVVRAHDTSAWRSLVKLVQRNKALSLAVLGLLVTAAAAATTIIWQQRQRFEEIQAEQQKTRDARDEALLSEAAAKSQTYIANVIAADVSLRANENEEARRRLEQCPPELRDWEWAHLALESDTSMGTIQHADAVTSVALDPAGAVLASASTDGVVRIFDARTLELRHELHGHDDRIHALSFSPAGRFLASASEDETVRVWDVGLGTAELTLDEAHEGGVTAIAFDATGARLASGSDDEKIVVWDATSGASLLELTGHEGPLVGVAFLPGDELASVADDGTLRTWSLATGEQRSERVLPEAGASCLAAHPDGSALALGGVDGAIHVWSRVEGPADFTLSGHTGAIHALVFGARGRDLLSASSDGTARVWDVAGKRSTTTLRGHVDSVLSVATSGDGELVATASRDTTARTWVPALGDNVRVLHGGVSHLTGMDESRDGRRVVATSAYPGGISVRDAASGAELLSITELEDDLPAVAMAPDGAWFVVAREGDATLSVFEAASGAVRHARLEGHLASITSLDVSPDGALIASAAMDGRVILWDAHTGERSTTFEDETTSMLCVAFSPDGMFVAAGAVDGLVRVWEVAGGVLATTLAGHASAVRALAFGPRAGELTSGSLDQTVHVWELATGATRLSLPGHAAGVVTLAIAPDARRIVSGSLDGTLRLWDAESGQHLLTLRGHGLPVTAVRFASGGERILSASFDDTLRVWETAAPTARLRMLRAAGAVEELRRALAGRADWVEAARERLATAPDMPADVRAAALEILAR